MTIQSFSSKSHFQGAEQEFSVGSLKGLRSWGMDEWGRLHGVTHREVWTPGENVARCQKASDQTCPRWDVYTNEVALYEIEGRRRKALTRPPQKPKPCGAYCDGKIHHHVQHGFDPKCECGFWAYGEDDFTSHGDVVGMIEGYGLTTIGTKGFRSQKARIIALVTGDLSRGRARRLAQLYPDVEFYETREELLSVYDAVLDNPATPESDPEFWTRPVPHREDTWAALPSSWMRAAVTNNFRFGGIV